MLDMLRVAVPLYVARLKEKGGPDKDDMAKAQRWSDTIGERGDILLCGGGKNGECAELFNGTAHAAAVLSFCPGGVEAFGMRWESKVFERRRRCHGEVHAGLTSLEGED